jgi:competence protein ComGF
VEAQVISMQEIIGMSLVILGIMWLVTNILNELLDEITVEEWLAKRNQLRKTKRNYQNCQNVEKND